VVGNPLAIGVPRISHLVDQRCGVWVEIPATPLGENLCAVLADTLEHLDLSLAASVFALSSLLEALLDHLSDEVRNAAMLAPSQLGERAMLRWIEEDLGSIHAFGRHGCCSGVES
jgi:hypothetical protein